MSAYYYHSEPTANGGEPPRRREARRSQDVMEPPRHRRSTSSSRSPQASPTSSSYPVNGYMPPPYYPSGRESRRGSPELAQSSRAYPQRSVRQSSVRVEMASSSSTPSYASRNPHRRSLELPALVASSRYDSGPDSDEESLRSPVEAPCRGAPFPDVHDMRMISQRFQYDKTPMHTKPMLPVTPQMMNARMPGGDDATAAPAFITAVDGEEEHPLSFPGGSDWHPHTTQAGLTGWAAYAGPRESRQIIFVTPSEW